MIDLIIKDTIECEPDDPVPARATIRTNLETREDYKFIRPFLYIVRTADKQAIGWGSLFMRHPEAPDYAERKHHTYLGQRWRSCGEVQLY